MRYQFFRPFLSVILLVASSFASTPKFTADIVPENMSVAVQKERFYYLVVPAVKRVHTELTALHKIVEKDLKTGSNMVRIEKLKSIYKVKSDRALLLALKPHPQSIALAQAAMESAWATSRFFIKAKNLFGVWSTNKEQARIAADEKRNKSKTIWLRKFESIEDSVREYYRMMGRGRAYKDFRRVRYESDDVFEIVKELHRYSEIGEKYTEEISSVIEYNKLTKYDKQ